MNYDNTDRGVLFKNDRKEKDAHPDYTGKINIGGTDHYLSAWLRDGKKGKFMSLSIGKAVGQADTQRQAGGARPGNSSQAKPACEVCNDQDPDCPNCGIPF